jgi:hypothetical protein
MSRQLQERHSFIFHRVHPGGIETWRRDDVVASERRHRNRDGPYPTVFFGVPPMTCRSPSQEHRDRTRGGDVAEGGVIGFGVTIVTFVSPFISKESPRIMHRRPLRGGRRSTTRRRLACRTVTGTPTVDIGSPSLIVNRILTGGRQRIIHVPASVSSTCREHGDGSVAHRSPPPAP